jgi:CheY-like chemotaxis protein
MPASQHTILVVDDDTAFLSLITLVLNDAGYAVRTARDGAQALQAIATDPPTLVLLDYAMPRVTGRDVLQQLRGAGIVQLPIVVVSAQNRAEECLRQGATAFIPKPFDLNSFLTHIARYIREADVSASRNPSARTRLGDRRYA